MEATRHDREFDSATTRHHSLGKSFDLVVEQVYVADPEPSRRKPGDITRTSWRCVRRDALAAGSLRKVGPPGVVVEVVGSHRPAGFTLVSPGCGGVVQHRRETEGQPTASALATEGDRTTRRSEVVRRAGQPAPHRLAVVMSCRKRVTWRKPVVRRDNGAVQIPGDGLARIVVLPWMADDIATAVQPQQR
ncbi:MAG: hypothetical protein JWP74_2499 [Marmoricola sp.]|nr:hypothetical protein [Marmoricola sp.]